MTAVTDAGYARESIAKGSKSFAAASKILPADIRDDVVRLYAWCRHADDLIDGQVLGHGERMVADPKERLARLRSSTNDALDGVRTGDPVFDGFGAVAATHGITPPLAHDLLDGFAMDVEGRVYRTEDDLAAYCYGVAGAVGVMMALVIGVPARDTDTLDRACDLGLAFQMTNIARDVIADAHLGRVYLPTTWLEEEAVLPTPEGVADPANAEGVFRATDRLVAAAECYYASAEVGMKRLPFRVVGDRVCWRDLPRDWTAPQVRRTRSACRPRFHQPGGENTDHRGKRRLRGAPRPGADHFA